MLFERIGFDDQEYIALLDKLIRHSKQVQNNPEAGLVPKESLIADEIKTYLGELPGLSITSYAYDKNNTRSNLIIRYKNSSQITNKQILFMGSHLDVVPADPKEWLSREPFKLIVEHTADDILLHGRGTTDCLGHVALLSMMIKKLAQKEVRLAHEIILVFIADEEVGSANVGVFRLYEDGLLDEFKQAPIYWVDTATDDGLFGPRVGTGGVGRWSVTITGKSGHSGYPQHCINPISVAVELINYINERFKLDFQNEEAQAYAKAHLYPSCSTCKCTGIISRSPGKNIIPGDCSFGGDVRFTPDFDAKRIKQALPGYVDAFNKKIIADDLRGPGVDGGAFMTLDSKNNKQYAQLNFFGMTKDLISPLRLI
jgi:acetylornithine deacetylase